MTYSEEFEGKKSRPFFSAVLVSYEYTKCSRFCLTFRDIPDIYFEDCLAFLSIESGSKGKGVPTSPVKACRMTGVTVPLILNLPLDGGDCQPQASAAFLRCERFFLTN